MKQQIINWGFLLIVALFITACGSSNKDLQLQEGVWRGELTLSKDKLPFNFEVEKKGKDSLVWVIFNDTERIRATETHQKGDSLYVRMPVFDSEFQLKIGNDGKSVSGVWVNHARKEKNVLAFSAVAGDARRFISTQPQLNQPFEGKWEVHFSPDSKADAYPAIGEFRQTENGNIAGTFLTETGDYRYLEGMMDGTQLKLSCFDGAHAFLFTANRSANDSLSGFFYSGLHHEEPWVGWRNAAFELQAADSLTFLKPGYEKVDFSFPDTDGKTVSLSDDAFKNKVVLVQIMGSWCPNCMDETYLFTQWHEKYQSQGLEIVALAFERSKDLTEATRTVARVKNYFGAKYPFLIAGTSDRTEAGQALPMLNAIMGYPTTIFIDKKGKVRKIHTGFSGPGTGKHYTAFVSETTAFVEKLLKE